MCFLGWVEETDSLLLGVRLLSLVKAERLIALNTKRLYLKRCDVVMGASAVFSKRVSSLKMMKQRGFWTRCSLAMLDLLAPLSKELQ